MEIEFGLQLCGVDDSICNLHTTTGKLVLIMHLDDILILGDDGEGVQIKVCKVNLYGEGVFRSVLDGA